MLISVSCGSNDDSTTTETQAQHVSAHQAPPEVEARILEDVKEDLRIIASAGSDTSQLSTAMTGKALDEMKGQIGKDLAEGKIRKRDYQNIEVKLGDYTSPVAEVLAEFDDMGYYTDANTGAALTESSKEHRSYALAVVEESGRWKIRLILSPSATTTTPDQGQTGQ